MKSDYLSKLLSLVPRATRKRQISKCQRRWLTTESLERRDLFAGVWTPLANTAPDFIGTMMLLTDGTVLAQGGGVSKDWYKLTPDNTGNYHNGTWSTLSSMSRERLYFGSNVLPDGRVYVLGGEYSGAAGAGTWDNTAEMYNSLTDSWANAATFPRPEFGDGQTILLTNGKILAGYLSDTSVYLYDPATDTWSQTGSKLHGDRSNEETWAMLPDGSIITADVFVDGAAQRYYPQTGTWVDAGTVPVTLTGPSYGYEMGPGTLLPDGRYFQVGANENTAIYDPISNTWTAGPSLPAGLGADDSPGAMLPNGHFIFAVDRPLFNAPTRLFDYDPFSNSWTEVTPAQLQGQLNQSAYLSRMLILPNGNMLMTTSSNKLWEYTPDSAPDPSWAPVITNISHTGNVYTVEGLQLNGLWEGATYGEDAEMSTNYPIAKLTDANGVVTYARTTNWTAAVATGNKIVSTDFILPNNLGPGPIKLNIIANGISSKTVSDIDDAIRINLNPLSHYTEDSVPVLLSPTTTVQAPGVTTFDQATLEIQIQSNADTGDTLGFGSSGSVSLIGTDVDYSGLVVGQLTTNTPLKQVVTLNANATLASIEALLQSASYFTTSQSPSTIDRLVLVKLDNGVNGSVGSSATTIRVTAVNDAPISQTAILPSVLEDAVFVSGPTIASITIGAVVDPDALSSVSGVVLVGNSTPAAEGNWQYSAATTGAWLDLPALSTSAGLALSKFARLRFLPGPNFSGPVTPLQYRAVDNTYAGPYTTATTPVMLNVNSRPQTGPISLANGDIGINVLPVNDPPVALQSSLNINVLQDQPIDQFLDSNLFFDIDSSLTYSFGDFSSFANWLHIDSQTLQMTGTPRNSNVGTLLLKLTASDGEYSAQIPITITVVNVNDAPEQLRMTGGIVEEGRFAVPIGNLFAVDPDGDAFSWSSSDPRFSVRDGQIILNTSLDYETPSNRQIPVTFTATDTGTPRLSTSVDVVISTLDVNESFPQLTSKTYQIDNTTPGGTLIDQLIATDADTAQTVRYRLANGDVSAFTIDEQSGAFRLANDVQLLPNTEYKVFVQAYDNGTPSFQTTSQMTVKIVPANFYAPVLAAGQSISFAENLPAGSLVGRVNVTDQDGNPIVFDSIKVDGAVADWLSIDRQTGQVYLTNSAAFDFESQSQFSATVKLHEDLANGHSVTDSVVIHVLDANDRPSGLGDLSVYPSRFGTPVTSAFDVQDQDVSPLGYQFATDDPRFEVRQGRLALKADQVIDPILVGQTLVVPVSVTDNSDSQSQSQLSVMVHVVEAHAWQNPINPLDVNRDGNITSSDALLVINMLNIADQARTLPVPRPYASLNNGDLDVTGNDFITPADALDIINYLNVRSGGGEGETAESLAAPAVDHSAWSAALQQVVTDWDLELRRKK